MARSWTRPELLAALREKMRQHGYLTMSSFPVDPFAIATREGLAVEMSPFEDPQLNGILFHDRYDSRVVLNASAPERQVFTLMHELIHFWFHGYTQTGHWDRQGSTRPIDAEANYAATEALMPARPVRRVALELDLDLRCVAHAFGVSVEAMRIRFEQLCLPAVVPYRRRVWAVPVAAEARARYGA